MIQLRFMEAPVVPKIDPHKPGFLDYTNHMEVYKYFAELQPDAKALRLMHRIAGTIYRPRVDFAEGVEEAIRHDAEEDVSYIFASNHARMDDQFPYAAMMHRNKVFHRFIGKTFILSKIEYFNTPWKRKIIEKWGALPVYRKQDVEEHSEVNALTVAQELQTTVVDKIVSGMSLFLFPEGTRKKRDQDKLGIVKKGLGRFACDAYEAGVQVSVLPMALYWGDSDNKRCTRRMFRPNIYVDMPIRLQGDENTPSGVMTPVRKGMAHSLETAKEASDTRWPTARLAAVRLAKRLKLAA